MLPMIPKKQKLVQKDLEVAFSTPLCSCFALLASGSVVSRGKELVLLSCNSGKWCLENARLKWEHEEVGFGCSVAQVNGIRVGRV